MKIFTNLTNLKTTNFKAKNYGLSLTLGLLLTAGIASPLFGAHADDSLSGSAGIVAKTVDRMGFLADVIMAQEEVCLSGVANLQDLIETYAGGDVNGILTGLPAHLARHNGRSVLAFVVTSTGYTWFTAVSFMAERGADFNRVDNYGFRPLDYLVYMAVAHGHSWLVKLAKLIACGADAHLLVPVVTEHLATVVPAEAPVKQILNMSPAAAASFLARSTSIH